MRHESQFYIGGEWVEPSGDQTIEVINPATEQTFAEVAAGTSADVDRAVAAAREAFRGWGLTPSTERADLLEQIAQALRQRAQEIGELVSAEMGMPIRWSVPVQAGLPPRHFANYARLIREIELEEVHGATLVVREPIGVCGFITPWNYPLHQIAGKVAPALAAGCSVVLKPSEVAPLDALVLAEVIDEVGLPAGVFNLVQGDGPTVGAAIAAHPGIDMVSFTGSTRAGVAVAETAARSVKRVTQELGGKSPNLILEDADLPTAVAAGVLSCFMNSGQACNAPSRMLVPRSRQEEAVAIASEAVARLRIGDPTDPKTTTGPLVSEAQYERVQRLIENGVSEGARLVFGGTGRPEGLEIGYYVRPTLFADVENRMTIAREEIFGPVLCVLPYDDENEAIAIANDTDYGLSAYVWSGDSDRARQVARRLHAGQVHLNGAAFDARAPFGGYKASGNGREFGKWGLDEYLETKAMIGYSG